MNFVFNLEEDERMMNDFTCYKDVNRFSIHSAPTLIIRNVVDVFSFLKT